MFYLTRQEQTVILFITTMALFGLGINFLLKIYPSARQFVIPVEQADKVNINRADYQDFLRMKGIGPVLAERIIAYRNIHGPFSSQDALRGVKGINEFKYNQIKDLISTE